MLFSKERKEKWIEIDKELGNQVINWDGQEKGVHWIIGVQKNKDAPD